MNVKRLLTVDETAEQLGLSPKTIRAWIYTRKLGFVRVDGSVRIEQAAVEDLIAAGRVPAKQ